MPLKTNQGSICSTPTIRDGEIVMSDNKPDMIQWTQMSKKSTT